MSEVSRRGVCVRSAPLTWGIRSICFGTGGPVRCRVAPCLKKMFFFDDDDTDREVLQGRPKMCSMCCGVTYVVGQHKSSVAAVL